MNIHALTITIVAAIFTVLTLAESAGAACAWVLWSPVLDERGRALADRWSIVGAYESKQECVKVYEIAIAGADKASPGRGMLCLPDTVDPRAPKGSGR